MPIPRVSGGVGGPKGPAHIRVSGKSLVITLDANSEQFDFTIADIKKDVPIAARLKTGKYNVSISQRGDRLWSIRPINGSFVCRTTRFAAAEGQPPAPKTKTGQFGPYLVWTPIHAVVTGEYNGVDFAGVELAGELDYKFLDAGGVMGLPARGSRVEKVVAYLEAAGIDLEKDEIQYDGNVLPAIERLILSRRKQYLVVVKDGWPVSYAPVAQSRGAASRGSQVASRRVR